MSEVNLFQIMQPVEAGSAVPLLQNNPLGVGLLPEGDVAEASVFEQVLQEHFIEDAPQNAPQNAPRDEAFFEASLPVVPEFSALPEAHEMPDFPQITKFLETENILAAQEIEVELPVFAMATETLKGPQTSYTPQNLPQALPLENGGQNLPINLSADLSGNILKMAEADIVPRNLPSVESHIAASIMPKATPLETALVDLGQNVTAAAEVAVKTDPLNANIVNLLDPAEDKEIDLMMQRVVRELPSRPIAENNNREASAEMVNKSLAENSGLVDVKVNLRSEAQLSNGQISDNRAAVNADKNADMSGQQGQQNNNSQNGQQNNGQQNLLSQSFAEVGLGASKVDAAVAQAPDFRVALASEGQQGRALPSDSLRGEVPRAALDMVRVNLGQAAANGQRQMTLQLRPLELGQVEVKLDFAEDGKMTAKILADRPETLNALRLDARSLETALTSAGFDKNNIDLSFDLRDQNSQRFNLGDGEEQMAGRESQENEEHHEQNADEDGFIDGENSQLWAVSPEGFTADGRVDIKI